MPHIPLEEHLPVLLELPDGAEVLLRNDNSVKRAEREVIATYNPYH